MEYEGINYEQHSCWVIRVYLQRPVYLGMRRNRELSSKYRIPPKSLASGAMHTCQVILVISYVNWKGMRFNAKQITVSRYSVKWTYKHWFKGNVVESSLGSRFYLLYSLIKSSLFIFMSYINNKFSS